jgi:hypothetical protein
MAFSIFPLHGIVRADGLPARCACTNPACQNIGKHPAIAWSRLTPGEQVRGNAGHGIATGHKSGVFVVDLDSEAANDAFDAMGECPPTYTVKTARGYHVYFKWPGWLVKTGKNVLGPGIDIRGDGGYVVMAGSEHESGALYVVCDGTDVLDAPEWLLSRPELRGSTTEVAGDNAPEAITPESTVWEERIAQGIHSCQTWDPHGGTVMFLLAIRLVRELELPLDACHELIAKHYNPRAVDQDGKPWPWTDKDIHHKLLQAQNKSTIKPGNASEWNTDAWQTPEQAVEDEWLKAISAKAGTTATPGAKKAVFEVEYGGLEHDVPTVYLVDQILPVASVAMFVAQPYVMKTWAAYSLAIAVAHGKPWLGKHATRQGKVLIIDYEMGKSKVKKRLRMLGDDGTVGRIVKPGARLDDLALWHALYEEKPALVIVDSLSAGNRANDENKPEFVFPLDRASDMANASGCSFIIIHHAVKDTNGRAKQGWVRGTGAIFGQLDVCYALETVAGGTGGEKRASVECIKMREGEEPPKFVLQLTDARGVELYEDEDQARARILKSGSLVDRIRVTIAQHGPMNGIDLWHSVGGGKRQCDNAVASMKADGDLVLRDRKLHLDGPEMRAERILRIATDESQDQSLISTPSKLADMAHASKEDVMRLLASKRLSRTSEGASGAWFAPEN